MQTLFDVKEFKNDSARDFKTKYFYLLIEHVLSRTVLCSMTWGEKIEIYGDSITAVAFEKTPVLPGTWTHSVLHNPPIIFTLCWKLLIALPSLASNFSLINVKHSQIS